MKQFIQNLYKAIKELGKLEAKVKPLLAQLSRDILALHSSDDDQRNDVRIVNSLISQLSPVNKRIACLFFREFLPYTFDQETSTFGKLQKKEKIVADKLAAMKEFLADESNNIWTWQNRNVDVERKKLTYEAKIAQLVEKSLTAKKDAISQVDVLKAVFAGGVTAETVIHVLQEMEVVNVVETEAASA